MKEKEVENLKFPLRSKYVAMLAPSFVVEFPYPRIISKLKELGFDKVVELTFGAKMVNRDYHKKIAKSKTFLISSACPGIVETIRTKLPNYENNLVRVDSPMIATGKICKKVYPKHKIVFISPCHYKKIEASKSMYIDFVIDYSELENLFKKYKIRSSNKKINFDKFYNDYTKIYPLSGALGKTAHLKGIICKEEIKNISGIFGVINFLKNPDKKIKFLDVLFCKGGCIGGPCVVSKLSLEGRKKKILRYLKNSKQEDIPEPKKGLISKARGLKFIH
jgi:iron only hydrogenase large subunit-like protein